MPKKHYIRQPTDVESGISRQQKATRSKAHIQHEHRSNVRHNSHAKKDVQRNREI